MKLKFYTDPGHGWLAVKRKTVQKLGILTQISRYSYQRGQTVYLEEDCDMPLFLKMAEHSNIQVEIENRSTNRNSPIRSYEQFVI